MPTENAKRRAQTKKRQGKAASTQAGEFVRSEMRKLKVEQASAPQPAVSPFIGLFHVLSGRVM